MKKIFALLFLFMVTGQFVSAQTVTSTYVNWHDMLIYEKMHPELLKPCNTCPKKESDEGWREISNGSMPFPPGAVIKKQKEVGPVQNSVAAASRSPIQDFLGYVDPGNTIPPDTHGAVGINHVITATNDYIKIHNKVGGAQVSQVSLSTFTAVSGTCDPYMTFDPASQRWIFSAINCSASSANPVILMVSNTADPTGTWRKITFVPTGTNMFLDHPYIGYDNQTIVISGRRFAPSFQGSSLFLINKADMLAGNPITFGTNAQQIDKTAGDGDAPLPVTVYEPPYSNVANPSPGTMYILQSWNGTSIRLSTVTGTIPTATWNTTTAVFPSGGTPWNAGSPGNVAQQMVETRGLNTNDARISCGVMMNGKIWASQHIAFPSSGTPTSTEVQWWQLDGSPGANFGNVLQRGRVPSAAGEWKYYSSIAVNKDEDVLIGYTASSTTTRVNSAYVTRQATTPANTTDDQLIYKTGQDRYWKDFGSGRARWGDYSHSALDPVDNSLWTIQEYAAPGNGTVPPDNNSRYGVWWAQVPRSNAPAAPIITAGTSSLTAESCTPANNAIDPNETVSISFCVLNVGTANTTNLVGTLLATGGVTAPSGPQTYGVVVAGGAAVCRTFSFTANAACGGTVTASIQLQDGATNLGTITYNFITGAVTTSFSQNFDAVTAPALPAGWVATNASGPAPLWVTTTAGPSSAPNSIFVDDPATISDKIIETPTIAIGAAGSSLSFKSNYTLESTFDGGVLEISINGGAYQDIVSAGGVFTAGGYTGTISSSFGNPLAGRSAWTGSSGGYITSTVTLPPAAAGQNVKFRFRMGSDNSVSATGWNVDDVTISSRACCAPAVAPTVTINQAATQPDPTFISPINFTVVFSEPVTGFSAAGVNLSGTAGATNKVITGGGATYNVAVSGMTSSGTVIATVSANAATGTINPIGNAASTSTDNTVTYNMASTCANVNPVPSDTVCNGAVHPAVTFTSPTPGAQFFWTNNNTAIGLAASGSGNLPAFTATNPGTAPIVGTVTVTPYLPGPITITSTLDAADPALPVRIFRDAVPGTCPGPKVWPGTFGTGPYYYETYTYVNTAATPVCVTATISSTTTNQAHVQAYLGSFNPANQATNFLSDCGSSALAGSPQGMAFNAPAGATIVFVVVEPQTAQVCPSYTLTINGLASCVGTPTSFNITVNPSGQVNAVPNQVLCRNSPTVPVNFTSTVPGTVFTWVNDNTNIGLAATGTGNIPSFIAQNPGSTVQIANITVTPRYGSGGLLTTQTFNYTGAVQTWVVPAGVTSINVKAWGAQGNTNALSVVGGLGGYAEGTLAVTPGSTLYINVGGGGTVSTTGGFNGGGDAGSNAGCSSAQGGGGGGASDVRVGANTLAARAIVAAGGGGAGGNRVAGCGRGTGGGGGAGYYGGGGGAGWPGVPGSEGPVPTGGTQSAGGAGGVTTWTGGGPTNGAAGALGVGGAGGIEVGSGQGGSATAQSGGVGGGLTGGSGLYVNTNNWTGQSGAGGSSYIGGVTAGLTNSGVRTGAGMVQFTYAAGGISCAGTPVTFTITVNPNQDLLIIADPGTTLCEGDPTLLTVYNSGGSTPPGNLYTQSGAPTVGINSQKFEAANAAFDNQGADDFTVPAGASWTVTNVNVTGVYYNGGGPATSLNVYFYSNSPSNLPGASIATFTNITTFTGGPNFNITLPTPVVLPAGTYWVSVQVNMAFSSGGQWGWNSYGTTNVGFERAWQNPPGGFATPCNAWGYAATGCGVGTNRNHVFTIFGTSVLPGGIATGTFLWSPAAGLSSTTSNPVAASPMNTTTYTVTRTTGQGCQASASITITVNKRPKVTAQPAPTVVCSGQSASFTVAGTGTGLTYQWQERTTPTGAWNNLANAAPYSGVNTATLTINPTAAVMNGYEYRCVLGGTCAPGSPPENVSNSAVLTVNPLPVVAITPSVACGGVAGVFGTALSVGSAPPPVPGQVSASSGPISIVVPDGTGVAATADLTIAGIPANATLTEVKVTFNMTHTWVGDMDVNIKAPNAAILNLVGALNNGTGNNNTANFTNTSFSSLGGATISGAPAPRTGTFAAEARTGYGPIGYLQPAGASWAALTPTATSANGTWRLAMGDYGAGDVGTLTSWSIVVNYTTPGGGGGPTLTYLWTPAAGLYINSNATGQYTNQNLSTVYAAPTQYTVYTVTATNVATGCVSSASAQVNYTPPAPTITPSSVTMCLGDPAVRLVAGTSAPGATATICSPTVNVEIPDANANPTLSTINVTTVPAGAIVTGVDVTLNIKNHTYPADLIINLKAPNGQILSLYKHNGNTNNGAASVPGAGFYNAVVSSSGTVAFTAVPTPFRYGITAPTGPFKADALNNVTNPGYPIMDPTGYVSNAANFSALYSTPNGTWTLAMADGGAGDVGTFTSWCIKINYLLGVPSTPAVWSPIAGLFTDPLAQNPYTGTPRDTVWTRPTPSGVYTYTATVQSVNPPPAMPQTPMAGGNGNNMVFFNVTNNNGLQYNITDMFTNTFGSGAVTARVFYKAAPIAGAPGLINAGNGWILSGTGNATVTAGAMNQVLSGLSIPIPAGATYGIGLELTGATFPAYTNGTATVATYTDNGITITVGGNVGWGGPAAPGPPGNNPRNFNGKLILSPGNLLACTSPGRTVTVTVKQPTTMNANLPADQRICTDKVATFTAAVTAGTGPFTYQWQVSTDGGNNFTNISDGGVYSGTSTLTLTVTAPPVTMNGYQYRCAVTGAPCAIAYSRKATLTVNPLPTVVISGTPNNSTLISLFPGLRTTLSSTVSPVAAATYTWLRDGIAVSGANSATLGVDVDGLGVYQLRVTDVNGCTNLSNTVTVKDSASGRCFLYPNPNSGIFQVRYYSVANNVLPRTLTVYNATGQKVFSKYYTVGRPYDRMDVDMRAYGKGVYTVEIGDLNGNRITTCRVVIQ